MGLFGRSRRANTVPTIPLMQQLQADSGQPTKAGGTERVHSSGGFMRPFMRKELPRTLQVVGATLRQLGNPQGGALDDFNAGEIEQQARDMAMRAYEQQQIEAKREEGGWDAYVATLPEDQQNLARFDRQGFLRSQMPLTAEERNAQDFRERQFQETQRHNRTSENLDYMRATRENQNGMPTLSEARQWTNSYNDDIRSANNDLGNMRAALPYAHQVIQSRGAPTGNFRMNDVALLRAAARAQTGPGVLTESEVFGTLSPSLQQSLTRNMAYADITRAGISPQDRLALAQYVQTAQRNASGDLWRRYNDAEGVLSARGVSPDNVGISAPEYLHPDDMDSFGSVPDSSFTRGRNYVAPSGRQYTYLGDGRWRYSGRNRYDRSLTVNRDRSAQTSSGGNGNRVRIDANGNVVP